MVRKQHDWLTQEDGKGLLVSIGTMQRTQIGPSVAASVFVTGALLGACPTRLQIRDYETRKILISFLQQLKGDALTCE